MHTVANLSGPRVEFGLIGCMHSGMHAVSKLSVLSGSSNVMMFEQAIKTIEKNGLQTMAKEAGINLWKLPFEDVSKARLDYLAANPQQPHIPKSIASRRMKNPEKLAASQKKPLVARYVIGGKIEYTRASLE